MVFVSDEIHVSRVLRVSPAPSLPCLAYANALRTLSALSSNWQRLRARVLQALRTRRSGTHWTVNRTSLVQYRDPVPVCVCAHTRVFVRARALARGVCLPYCAG
jgi:hypothetical protein